MNRREIINEIKSVVKKENPDARIILFGSEARGDSRPDSDIDVLILLNKYPLTYSDRSAVTGPLFDLELETGVVVSPVVFSRKEWENRPFKTPFYVNIQNEGVPL
ncbi:nucleotidyltransferase domain-containing protein [Marinilabilia rubra]|uniref:Polymerase nucleotidyl transferase domain-containing protein n=1 Tax=Marinilabilia rubra TaxID=2162893 RepID=A0A2U2B4L5_9BACT|nr:nucleotidyltransferase domain-containing protein [Marinilabilia rubra]PWD97996.1 hypothetical protein DDZ16_18160 [Marinilabilia rubra]